VAQDSLTKRLKTIRDVIRRRNISEERVKDILEAVYYEMKAAIDQDRESREINSFVQCDHCGEMVDFTAQMSEDMCDKMHQEYSDGFRSGQERSEDDENN